jgi:hypothetical protein
MASARGWKSGGHSVAPLSGNAFAVHEDADEQQADLRFRRERRCSELAAQPNGLRRAVPDACPPPLALRPPADTQSGATAPGVS